MPCQEATTPALTSFNKLIKISAALQKCLADAHGSQCGFCTPGFVMSMYALTQNKPRPTVPDIEEALAGNLCRCTGYRPILDAFSTFACDHQNEVPATGCAHRSTTCPHDAPEDNGNIDLARGSASNGSSATKACHKSTCSSQQKPSIDRLHMHGASDPVSQGAHALHALSWDTCPAAALKLGLLACSL